MTYVNPTISLLPYLLLVIFIIILVFFIFNKHIYYHEEWEGGSKGEYLLNGKTKGRRVGER